MDAARGSDATTSRLRRLLLAPLLYGSLAIPVVAAGLLMGTYALLGVSPSTPLLVVACCSAFLVYQLERVLLGGPEDTYNHPERTAWLHRHAHFVAATTGLAVVGVLAALPLLRPATVLTGLLLAVPGVLYALPVGAERKRLKAVWRLKPVLIASVWAVGAALLPAVEAGVPIGGSVAALAVYRTGYILPNAVLADWPDRRGDARAGLRTPATEWSAERLVRRTALAASLLLALGAVSAALPLSLLAVDVLGPVLLLLVAVRRMPASRWFYGVTMDLLVAWPWVTYLVALGY